MIKFNTFQNKKYLEDAQKKKINLKNFNEVLTDDSKNIKSYNSNQYLTKGNTPVIDQGINFIAGYVEELVYEEIGPRIIFGDHTRIIKYVDFPFVRGADGTKVLKLVSSENDLKYMYYYLKFSSVPNNGYSRHFKFLKQLIVPVPSLENQQKIANILDLASELIEKRKEQLTKMDQLIQSVFYAMFGNVFVGEDLKVLGELITLNPSKNEVKNLSDETKVSFLPMSNVSETGIVNLSEERKLYEVYKGFTYFKDNDVIVAKITPCFENGKGAVVKFLKNSVGFGSTEFHVLRSDPNILNPRWLYQVTTLPEFRIKGEQKMRGSAGQKRVPKTFIENLKIIIAPIDRQNEFASIVDEIEAQKRVMEESLKEMENNYNALMQKAFRGELFPE